MIGFRAHLHPGNNQGYLPLFSSLLNCPPSLRDTPLKILNLIRFGIFPSRTQPFKNIKYTGTYIQKDTEWTNRQEFCYLKYFLPLDGSGKIPWLLLLMTDGFGDCWLLWLEWDLPWSMLSVCSLSGYHLGVLSRWDVLDKSISTWKKMQ